MKVLVVDDSKPIFMMVSQMLEELGHQAVWAENGQDAIEKINENADFELVLLDWNMPIMSGIDFLKTIRADDSYGAVKVIMCTSESEKERVLEALKAGASNYIVKPFDAAGIKEKLGI